MKIYWKWSWDSWPSIGAKFEARVTSVFMVLCSSVMACYDVHYMDLWEVIRYSKYVIRLYIYATLQVRYWLIADFEFIMLNSMRRLVHFKEKVINPKNIISIPLVSTKKDRVLIIFDCIRNDLMSRFCIPEFMFFPEERVDRAKHDPDSTWADTYFDKRGVEKCPTAVGSSLFSSPAGKEKLTKASCVTA